MKPEEARKLLHAYVDGELDAPASLDIEAALAADPALRAAHERLRAMSTAVREKGDYHATPAGFARRLGASLPARETAGGISLSRAWLWPSAALAVAALLAVGVYFQKNDEGLADGVFA